MAQIELRNATIRIIDGFTNTAQVNDIPINGDTVVDIDTLGVSGIIAPGTRFTVVGSSLTHYTTNENSNEQQLVTVDATSGNFTLGFQGTVANPIATQTTANISESATAATVQAALEALAAIVPGDVIVTGAAGGPWTIEFTGQYKKVNIVQLIGTDVDLMGGGDMITVTTPRQGGVTWQINFTPAFATATGIPADNALITFSGHTLEVKIGDGALSYTENREMEYRLDRGELDTVREGDDQPMEVSMDFVWEFITAVISVDLLPTIEDAIKKRGLASTWVSSDAVDPCAPYAVDLEIEHDPPCGNEQRELILLPDFRWESLEHNAVDAQISMTGRCNSKEAVVTRVA